jgi:hypothetical protein
MLRRRAGIDTVEAPKIAWDTRRVFYSNQEYPPEKKDRAGLVQVPAGDQEGSE